MPHQPLHERVRRVVETYLETVDADAPDLIEGLYLIGSVALGEFRPRTSDIDFVAVTAGAPDAVALAALARTHQRLRRRCRWPHFDGVYVTWTDLSRAPHDTAAGASSYEGRLRRGPRDCNPVTWHTLARHGIRCRGPAPATLSISLDEEALASWMLRNFETYWRPLLRRARRPGDPWSLTSFTSYGAAWIVLGVCRLHCTLATGTIVSKEAAGNYGLQVFPVRWHRVLNEALRIRRSDRARADVMSAVAEIVRDLRLLLAVDGASLYRTPVARRGDVLAFAEMVIADASRRYIEPGRT